MDTKIIIISGGSSGIGYAYAKALSPENKVIILGRNEENLRRASEELNCEFEICDITNTNSISSCVDNISKKYDKIDVLINNAGIWLDGLLEDNYYNKISELININLTGQIFLTKAFLTLLKKSGKGLIVTTNSDAGKRTRKGLSVYNASKWGLEGFVGAMKEEIKDDKIEIISIYPGGVNTPLFEKGGSPRDQSNYIKPSTIAEIIKKNIWLYFDEDTVVDEVRLKHIIPIQTKPKP